jgi:hypothetical protein
MTWTLPGAGIALLVHVADALGVTVAELEEMARGRVQWSKSQRKRAAAALAKHELTVAEEDIPPWERMH